MSRHESQLPGNEMSDEFKSFFQIDNKTGISNDYMNQILKFAIQLDREEQTREKLPKILKGFTSYSEYIKQKVEYYNEFQTELKSDSDKVVSAENFVTAQNREAIAKLDAIAVEIKAMGNMSPEEIDIEKIKQLMYEAAVLIYGEGEAENFKEMFKID